MLIRGHSIIKNTRRKIVTIYRVVNEFAFGKAIAITSIYIVFGFLWIIFSDTLADLLIMERSSLVLVSTIKGCLYVVLTAGLIFSLIYPAFKKIIVAKDICHQANTILDKTNYDLNKKNILFRSLIDQAEIGVAICHNNQFAALFLENVPGINPKFEQLTGRTVNELNQLSWKDLLQRDYLKSENVNIQRFENGDVTSIDFDQKLIRPDGSEIWVHMVVSRLQFDRSNTSHQLCILEDVSVQKELQKKLFESQRSKTILIENLPGMVYRCHYDKDWSMLFVSGGCYTLTGYSPESFLNKSITYYTIIAPISREYIREKWTMALEDKTQFAEEYEIVTASGETKWVWDQGQGVFDTYGTIVSREGIIIDITKRKEQEIKLSDRK